MLGHCSSFYLGQEEPLEKEIVTHSSILAIDRGSWQTIVHGVPKSRTWWSMHAYTHTQYTTCFGITAWTNPNI